MNVSLRELPALVIHRVHAKRARRVARAARRRLRALTSDVRDVTTDVRDRLAAGTARRALSRTSRGTSDTAVVLHLYYAELWPWLVPYLERLRGRDVDLFVTLPRRNAHAVPLIRETFPDARCVVVPNRGRDVLPFVLVAEHLASAGYEAALKIHSKKSEHFGGGDHWRQQMLDELLPSDPAVLTAILDTLHRPQTGMVGPWSAYFALSTYWAGNADTVRRLLEPLVPPTELDLLSRPQELGFFAGTMFWVRLDAVRPLLAPDPLEFVREPTPKDGTLAHGWERAISVLPELLGRDDYDSDGLRIAPRPRRADPLPEWYRSATKAAKASEQARTTTATRKSGASDRS